MMDTLYDLLGALPHDDAEGLRTAFRKAVKGAHPDIRPDDPDAALKFREIVRANEILGDADQRAAYDHLLKLARLEQKAASEHAIAARIHKLASGVIALAGASVVTVGGYLLFMHMSVASVAPADNVDVTMRASPEIAAISAAESSDATDKSASGNGGLNGSIAGLDQAMQLDPKFLRAYVDRGIIFYRLRKSGRAFPDVARAKRTEKASHSKSAPTMARKPRFDQAAIAPSVTPLFRRRTAAQDPSREEGVGR